MLQIVFPEPEFRLFPFEDGQELLDAAAGLEPDAVLLSPGLSGRDGYEVGRLLRARDEFKRVPILFLRGTFEAFDRERAAAAGSDEIFQKPFDSERLADSVRALIVRKTGPSTVPEEPEPETAGGTNERARTAGTASFPPSVPESPSAAGQLQGPVPPGLRDWVRKELVGTELEIEKRVRARVLADLKEWVAANGKDFKGTR
jgi:CheY-like chemotaxis protein